MNLKNYIIIIFFLIIIPTTQAYMGTINTFSDLTNTKNQTYTQNTLTNNSWTINIPINAIVTNLTIQLRGHPNNNYTIETQNLANVSETYIQQATGTYGFEVSGYMNFINQTQFSDQNITTFTARNGSGLGYILINYTPPNNVKINSINFSWIWGITIPSTASKILTPTCLQNNPIQLKIQTVYPGSMTRLYCGEELLNWWGSEIPNYYESWFIINYTTYPTNITTYTCNQQDFNYTNILNNTITRTLNITNLNNCIHSCTCKYCSLAQNNCTIPINITSQTTGTLQNTLINLSYQVQQNLQFDTNVTGYVSWNNRNTLTTDGYYFTSITDLNLTNITTANGLVSIVFNNQQQLLQYLIDTTWNGTENIHIETPDVSQTIKIWDGTQTLQGMASAYKLVNDTFYKTYQIYTDKAGEANLQLTGANTYKLKATVTGYAEAYTQKYIQPTTLTTTNPTILITVTPTTTTLSGTPTLQSSCPMLITNQTTCTFTATDTTTHTYIINVTQNGINSIVQYDNTTSLTAIIIVTNTTTFRLYTDNNQTHAYQIIYQNITATTTTPNEFWKINTTMNIGASSTDKTWILANTQTRTAFIIFIIISAALIGLYFETKFQGWGLHTFMLYLTMIGGFLYPIFYIGTIGWGAVIVYVKILRKEA